MTTWLAFSPAFCPGLTMTLTMPHRPLSEVPARTSPRRDRAAESCRALGDLLRLSQRSDQERHGGEGDGTVDGIIGRSVLRSLLSTLQARDISCVRHSRRVAQLAVTLAESLGWEGRQLRCLEVAALLHDIGKIGVPDNILFKPAKLSPDELELMALHYNIGLDVLQTCRVDREVLAIVSESQQANLGPDGMKRMGREPHLGARILAVADAYEALCTDQVYRPGRPHDEIIKILTDASGTQFDGNIVHALSRYVRTHGLPFANSSRELDESLRNRPPQTPEELLETQALGLMFSYLYVLESLYDGFYLMDADLRVVCWNRGVETLLGRPASDMLGRTWTSRLLDYHDLQNQPLGEPQCPLHAVMQQHASVVAEIQLPRADGRHLRIESQTIPLLDEHGRLLGVLEILRDLTRSGGRRPQEFRELKLAATRDALTSVANRGELETQLTALITDFSRNPLEPFSVIFVDADHFKSVNDKYGHAVGDQVLIDIARLLQQETYSGELVGRYGGEEFIILCPGANLEEAVRKAERLRTSMRNSRIGGRDQLRVTASFGVAQAEPGDSVESVLRRADKALYLAKEQGRDRTCSLMNAQLLAGDGPRGTTPEAVDPFEHTTWFAAVVAADMVVYKLGGYVSDNHAKLLEVTNEHVLMRLGRRSAWSYLGLGGDSGPLEVKVMFGTALGNAQNKGRSQAKVNIGIKVRPLSKWRHAEAFQHRATAIVRELKNYFAGD
jgi:diguanylate cyclase (GGDEF)-like protein/putative nucleotidyltransferase with HDIG domain/PAS domain S-box-containing protein